MPIFIERLIDTLAKNAFVLDIEINFPFPKSMKPRWRKYTRTILDVCTTVAVLYRSPSIDSSSHVFFFFLDAFLCTHCLVCDRVHCDYTWNSIIINPWVSTKLRNTIAVAGPSHLAMVPSIARTGLTRPVICPMETSVSIVHDHPCILLSAYSDAVALYNIIILF